MWFIDERNLKFFQTYSKLAIPELLFYDNTSSIKFKFRINLNTINKFEHLWLQ